MRKWTETNYSLWPWDSCYHLCFLLQQCQETKTVVLLHLKIRPTTPSASLNAQASKKSYASKVTCTLQTKRKPDARIVCTSNNLVWGDQGKSTNTLNWSIQQSRFLNILHFLIEKVHCTLLRLWSIWVRQEIYFWIWTFLLPFKRNVCIEAANLEPQFPVAIFWFSLPLPFVHPKKYNWPHTTQREGFETWAQAGMSWNYAMGRATVKADSLYTFSPETKWTQIIPALSWLNEGMLFTTSSPLSVLHGRMLVRVNMWMTA